MNLLSKLTEAYNVSCPVCNRRWSFKITGGTSWVKEQYCGHSEMESLIAARENQLIIGESRQPLRPFANTDKSQVKMTITYGKSDDPKDGK